MNYNFFWNKIDSILISKRKENKMIIYLKLAFIFFKLGLFSFGGGYSMLPLIEKEAVEKHKFITSEEMSDILVVSESTPGPLAINCATFVGYKVGKFLGALISTIFVVLPSFIIILLISLFINQFLSYEYVNYAFDGIRIAVAILICEAGLKMLFNSKKNILFYLLFIVAFLLSIFVSSLSSALIIIGGGVIGFIFTYIKIKRGERK